MTEPSELTAVHGMQLQSDSPWGRLVDAQVQHSSAEGLKVSMQQVSLETKQTMDMKSRIS